MKRRVMNMLCSKDASACNRVDCKLYQIDIGGKGALKLSRQRRRARVVEVVGTFGSGRQ